MFKSKSQMVKLLELLIRANQLKRVKRTGWVLKGVKDAESVADHTWGVSLIALLLAGKDIDNEKLMKMIAVHDLGEIVPGDVRWEQGKKVIGLQSKKRSKELKTLQELFRNYPKGKESVALLKEFNENKTPEAKFLKRVEKLEMALQAYIYESSNEPRKPLDEFFENAEKYIRGSELEPIFKLLQKMRKR